MRTIVIKNLTTLKDSNLLCFIAHHVLDVSDSIIRKQAEKELNIKFRVHADAITGKVTITVTEKEEHQ